MRFELFGNYNSFSENDLKNKILELPFGSTLIITAATTHNGIRSISDELIVTSLIPHEKNPYLRFLKYLVCNSDNNYLFIKTQSEIRFFTTSIDELSGFSDTDILKWQQKQIRNKKYNNITVITDLIASLDSGSESCSSRNRNSDRNT